MRAFIEYFKGQRSSFQKAFSKELPIGPGETTIIENKAMTITSELQRRVQETAGAKENDRAALWGTLFCLLAALLYTGTNMALRRLAEPGQAADRVLTLFIKETVTVLVVGPWIAWQLNQGRIRIPAVSHLLRIVGAGIPTQVVANLGLLWAFGVIGIAIAIPLSLATSLITAAWLGRFWLREPLSPRLFGAMALLVAGVVILHWGSDGIEDVLTVSPVKTAVAVGLCCLAGFIYGVLTVVIRQVTTAGTSGWFVLFLVTGSGTITLGPYSLLTQGPSVLLTPSAEHWLWMIVAGVLNLMAFWSLTKGLQKTPVARANLLTSSQAAMATLAGWFVFGETINLPVGLGILLTLIAIVLSSLR